MIPPRREPCSAVRETRSLPRLLRLVYFAFLPLSLYGIVQGAEETPWEWTPYSIRLSFDASESALLRLQMRNTGELVSHLVPSLEEVSRNRIEGLWRLTFEAGSFPDPLFRDEQLADSLTPLSPEIRSILESKFDKFVYIRIEIAGEGLRIEARELDVRTCTAYGRGVLEIGNVSELPDAIFQAVLESFSLVAEIEQVLPKNVVLRVRGGELVPANLQSRLIGPGALFVPFLRTWNRSGQVDAIKVIPWTALQAETVQGSRVECSLETGIRNPLSIRRRSLSEQIAILPRLPQRPTRLLLTPRTVGNKEKTNEDADFSPFLSRYGIYERTSENDKGFLLGESNSRGEFTVPYSDESPVRRLVIREGELLIARLPLIQGWKSDYVVMVPDDETRVAAESVLMGMQEDVIDQITLRMILKARIEKFETTGNTQGLTKAKMEYERLKTRDQFLTQLDLERRKFHSPDPIVQKRIEKMFDTTRKIIDQHWK